MERLYSVQYLRGCAALLVVIAHAFSHQIGVDNHYAVLAGQLGVTLFFVISGFIMVYISGAGPFSATAFLKRRIVRIVPLYWLFTCLAALLIVIAPSAFRTTVFTWPHFLQSLLFIVHEAPSRGGVSPLLSLGWTLNYEAFFYVVFAILAALAVTARIVIITILFVTLWLLGALLQPSNPVVYFYLNISPLAFAVGAWIGWAKLNGRLQSERARFPLLNAMALIGLMLSFVDQSTPLTLFVSFAGQLLCTSSLLVRGLILEPSIRKSAVLEKLGDASYAIYLSHMFVIGAVVVIGRRLVEVDSVGMIIIAATVSTVAATVGGIVVHEAVEKPILRLFSQKRRKPQIA